MTDREEILKKVGAAFEFEPRINLHKYPVEVDFSEGSLTLEGTMENVAAKKLALELAVAVPGVTGIIDRLKVLRARRYTALDAHLLTSTLPTWLGPRSVGPGLQIPSSLNLRRFRTATSVPELGPHIWRCASC
jgi:hypothetical protein